MKSKCIVSIILWATVTAGAWLFISKSNDHMECNETVEYTKDANGNLLTTTIHNCKERFSF